MKSKYSLILLLPTLFLLSCTSTQQVAEKPEVQPLSGFTPQRPVVYDIDTPESFTNAVENGTRTGTGQPGTAYWQNEASYTIQAELNPENHTLKAEADVIYNNHSPDALNAVVVELAQNLHKAGTPKKEQAEITGGKQITSIRVNGQPLDETTMQARWTQGASGYIIDGTRLYIFPDSPVSPDDSIELHFEWNFEIPEQGASGRMGRNRGDLYMISYWYPHIAVYDDVYGWMDDSFLGNAEFYHGFADYELHITAPREWIVMATGEFLNPEETLHSETLERYHLAAESDTTVTIVDFEGLDSATAPSDNGTLTWKFQSDRVRNVAFSATLESQWDGSRAAVGDLNNDGETDYTRVHTFYRDTALLWSDVTDYARHAMTYLSEYTAMPYPWPHMTSVEGAGIIQGGMEFPMMTLMGDYNRAGPIALYGVTAHEFAHMWVPMMVSTNERRYTWIDEGHTTFHTQQANVDRYGQERFSRSDLFGQYLQFAGSDFEGEMMRWSDFHYPGPAYSIASYPKPASVLTALRGVLGDDLFLEAHREFMHRWEYKHPYPWDFFNTVEDVTGRDLSWFWKSWYYETWTLDQAVGDVINEENRSVIVIDDRGNVPMPVYVEIHFEDGSVLQEKIPVDHWLEGNRQLEYSVESGSAVTEVTIDPDVLFPDVNRKNNSWTRQD